MTRHSSTPQIRPYSSMGQSRSSSGRQSPKSMATGSMRHFTLVSGTLAAMRASMSAKDGVSWSEQMESVMKAISSITSSMAKANSPIQLTTPMAGTNALATLRAINCMGQGLCGGPTEIGVKLSGFTIRWRVKAFTPGLMGSSVKSCCTREK